jgi:predicted nucleic-acid-binding Zn-ribbon protein
MNVICPKCNTIMTKSRATSAIGKFAAIKEPVKNFTTKESSALIPHVCSKCGYTEWYVEDPENFENK